MNLGGIMNQLVQDFNIPVLSALALGLLTAISPCPMATNIAALAYVNRRAVERKYAVITGTLYTVGRMFSYSILGILIIMAGIEIPGVASFLQDFGEQVLGPLLIVVGLIMLNINRLSFNLGGGKLASIGGKVADWGMIGGFLLGALFALAFCPYSAVLFFGVLIPLALKSSGGVALPAVYAIGTGLPVLVFGTLLSIGVARVSTWLNAVTRAEKVIRIVVSIIFIGVGIYYVVLWIQTRV
ncbi:MAG: cytochrome C biogenesis protein [Chloroflexi bacterium CG_4_9_14_3_um_filter_45_9]|nr:MAG: cytochrome C biogenesis protein [Chloroflexi bacterium CG08_land_8_20_14_0_20_45_12]PIX26862.1 MAG: cytochrome C biogenesis protein [Chloroflexi bacterium CG_4_8_14_3_um_filter_45_15]PJB47713.1 MAG: cytochrome C biogenesis protein [Chloroflexi bacterium CG_4_9_14_3_um_filter_45_9]